MQMKRLILAALLMAGGGLGAWAQVEQHPIPKLEQKDGRYALMVDGGPFLILGAQANNSSDWPSTLPKVWSAMEYLHANTLEIPIYWEQFEPKPGVFDYAAVDLILAEARQHHVHLVLLWFATWKNGSQHYMPEWMKLEPERFAHVTNKDGEWIDSPSPFAQATLEEESKAFAIFMRHLKAADAERIVLMVQVENETGTWGSLRDYSPAAEKVFQAPVPADVLKAMNKWPQPAAASWKEVFGGEAEVNFHAWAVAKYVGQVAAAGKAEYALPMYVNAALRDPLKPGAPGSYESGGPTDNVLPIWKAAAPAIDILAPDDYIGERAGYMKVLDLYQRPDNALFLPETIPYAPQSRWFFSVLGHQAIGYSPFGMDYTRTHSPRDNGPDNKDTLLEPTALNYRLIGPMMREVARLSFEGKLQAVTEEEGETTQTLHFGAWDAVVSYGAFRGGPAKGNKELIGRALIGQLKENQFLVAAYRCTVDFRPAATEEQQRSPQYAVGKGQIPSARIDGKWVHRQFLRVEEGSYENGAFKFARILNGDQTDYGLEFKDDPGVLRVSLATY
jgi:hypothetical protein